MDRSQIEKISKALADETRLRIYEAIAARSGMTCGDIVATHGVTPATISHHLKILADAGLIECRKQGQFVHSQAVSDTIASYASSLTRLVAGKRKKPLKRQSPSR
jgi:ArsR family transcriptional regulator, arsenate/arsenite/antimonite-responsive transcriptional repressor